MTPRPGDEVRVDFRDHVENGDEPALFSVWGRVVRTHDDYLVLDSWAYRDPKHERDDNVQTYTIVRSAIEEVHIRNRMVKARRKRR